MTDGIIQKVFKKWEIRYPQHKYTREEYQKYPHSYCNDNTAYDIRKIKQELIEEIEKEIEFSDSQGKYINLRNLIGDTE